MSDALPARDRLFLLAPGFRAGGRREFCPECAEIWGVLNYYPAIIEALAIVYQPLAHPRPALVARLGPGRWNCPTLVLADDSDPGPDVDVKHANGAAFLDNARDIAKYFAYRYGAATPRGS